MNIGILTFHYAHNYGAVLQAYALKTYLTNRGNNVEIINYRNKTIASSYKEKLSVKFFFKDLYHPRRFYNKIKFMLNICSAQKQWTEQYRYFKEFIENYLSSSMEISYHDLPDYVSKFDVLITGSDQVWSSDLTGGIDSIYLLDFPFSGKKVSYAASNGNGVINKSELQYFEKALKQFALITTREKLLAESVKNELKLNAYTVVDPTLLIDKNGYESFIAEKPLISGKYIFVYYVCEDKGMKVLSETVSSILGYKIIELHYYASRKFDNERQFANFGPREFLNAIQNAAFVITNSFHGTVLSIIFNRNFLSYYAQNERIENLLNQLLIQDRHILPEQNINKKTLESINFDSVNERLRQYKLESVKILNKVIGIPEESR